MDGVLDGSITAPQTIIQAATRQQNDLRDSKGDSFPYYFDEEEAERILKIVRLHRHTKGEYKGRFFDIQPFQAFFFACVYGWRKKSNNKRRFTKVYFQMPRKGGKSEVAAVCGSIALTFDGENTPEVFTLATSAKQASIVFELIKAMLRQMKKDSETIKEVIGIHRYRIWNKRNDGILEAWSSESSAGKRDGDNPHLAIVDEYHASKTDDLLKAAEMGMGSRRQPMTLITTTPGFILQGPCKLFSDVCKKILRGELENDSIFAQIYEPDEDDYENEGWEKPEVWKKVIPNLGKAPYLDWVEEQYKKAKSEGGISEIHFKTKVVGMWVGTHATWVQDAQWMKGKMELPDLSGKKCYGGLDLSDKQDLTAFVLTFPPDEKTIRSGSLVVCNSDEIKGLEQFKLYEVEEAKHGDNGKECLEVKIKGKWHDAICFNLVYYQLYFFWTCEGGIRKREKQAAVPYRAWVKKGLIKSNPGVRIDKRRVRYDILQLAEKYNIVNFKYDRWNSSETVQELEEEGATMDGFGQGFRSMSEPTKELESLHNAAAIRHDGNPVQRWQMGNVSIEIDPADNVKISKKKSQDKVDGPVASVMSLAGAMEREEETAFWGFA